jgi:hypothetical protein
VTDDTAAIQASATAAAGKRLIIPAGTYPVKAVSIPADTEVICDRSATFIPSDTTDATSANFLVNLSGDNITWQGGKFLGQISTTFGVVPKPYYCLKVFENTGNNTPENITIRDVVVVGGYQGIWAIGSDGMTVENVTVDRCYQWGLAFPAPRTKRLRVNGFRALNTGINEGLKIASLYQQTGDASADILLTNLHIEGCGGLDPNSANWQNGIDCFISAAQRLEISNFNLVNNYAGGIEIKRNHAPDITPNEYKNIRIANGHITSNQNDSSGIALNITSPDPIAADTAKMVSISNVQFDYVGPAAPASVRGITMSAWADVTISNCQFFGDFTSAINPSALGSFDNTLRRLFISDCFVQGSKYGFIGTSGVLERVTIANCLFLTTEEAIIILGSATGSRFTIQGGLFESSGATSPTVYFAGNVTGTIIRDADIRGLTYALRVNDGTGSVFNCRLESTNDEAMRVSGGTWSQYENEIVVDTAKSAFITTAGTLTSYRNNRGSNTTTPTLAAKVGEIVWHSSPAAAGNVGWICTTAGNPGTWKTFGNISA